MERLSKEKEYHKARDQGITEWHPQKINNVLPKEQEVCCSKERSKAGGFSAEKTRGY